MTDAIHAVDSALIGAPGCATNTYLDRSIKPFVRTRSRSSRRRGATGGVAGSARGAPAYDFLAGAGGFAQVLLTGFRWRADRVHLDPMLPPQLSGGVTWQGLHWQGRTFDVRIGPGTSTVTVRSGGALPVETQSGTQTVGSGSSLSMPTRRPDLAPTTNVARCKQATASSEEAGMYAESAVDGSRATIWAPDASAPGGSLTVDLGGRTDVAGVAVQWTDVQPASSSIQTSSNGNTWTDAPPADSSDQFAKPVRARYVRVNMTRAAGAERTGIREVVVTMAT